MARTLFSRGFISLLITQFFGAVNDNILKQVLTFMVATGLWADRMDAGGQAYIALCLTLPFILFSGFGGQVADRFSKRSVMLGIKIAEVPISIFALIGLMLPNLGMTMTALVLLAIQSSFFGPVKYGVVPELVADGDLSRANGGLNMFTNVAIIVGIVLAGPLSDLYYPDPDPQTGEVADSVSWAPGAAMIAVAVLGLFTALLMPPLKPGDPNLRYTYNPFSVYVRALKEMYGSPLFIITLAWGFFYMIGMLALLILAEYKDLVLLGGEPISYQENSYLFGVLAISIGVGSVLAGLISGNHIKPRLIPIGAVGMTLFFFLLGAMPLDFWTVGALLLVAGIFAGFYVVPLQALLQKLSPDDERGRFLGTANALSFCFSSAGAVAYWIAANRCNIPANRIFLVCGALALLGTGYALWRLRKLLKEHATV